MLIAQEVHKLVLNLHLHLHSLKSNCTKSFFLSHFPKKSCAEMEGRRSRNSEADAKVEGRTWLWTLMLSMENWKSGNLICKSFDFYASFSKQVSFFFLSVHFYLVSCCHDQRSHIAAHTCVIKEAIWSICFKHKKKK